MKRGPLVAVLVAAAFVGFLLWTTLSAQKIECSLCVEFGGSRNCATATADDSASASQTAQTTACGPLAAGMTESIACGNTKPISRVCRIR